MFDADSIHLGSSSIQSMSCTVIGLARQEIYKLYLVEPLSANRFTFLRDSFQLLLDQQTYIDRHLNKVTYRKSIVSPDDDIIISDHFNAIDEPGRHSE